MYFFFLRLACTCEEICEPFGHPAQVSTQVQLASTCDYLPVRLAKALVIRSCLLKSRIANFTVLNMNVNRPRDLSDLFDCELLILEQWELQFCHATFNIFIFIFNITVLTEILVVYQLNKGGLCSARE